MTVDFAPLKDPAPENFELHTVREYTVRAPGTPQAHELVGTSLPLAGQDLAMPDLYMSTATFFSADRNPAFRAMSLDDVTAAFDAGLEQLVAQYQYPDDSFITIHKAPLARLTVW